MSTGISSILGYWSKTVVMEGCSPRIHCCLAAAVLDIAPRWLVCRWPGQQRYSPSSACQPRLRWALVTPCHHTAGHRWLKKKTFRFTVLIKWLQVKWQLWTVLRSHHRSQINSLSHFIFCKHKVYNWTYLLKLQFNLRPNLSQQPGLSPNYCNAFRHALFTNALD